MSIERINKTIRLPDRSEVISGIRETDLIKYTSHIRTISTQFGHRNEGTYNEWDISACSEELTTITSEVVDAVEVLQREGRSRDRHPLYIITSNGIHASGSLKAEFLYSHKLARMIVDTLYDRSISTKATVSTRFDNLTIQPSQESKLPATRRLINKLSPSDKKYKYELQFKTTMGRPLSNDHIMEEYRTPATLRGIHEGKWIDSHNIGLIFDRNSEFAKSVPSQEIIDLADCNLYTLILLD